mgnify:CR=1 FL=1
MEEPISIASIDKGKRGLAGQKCPHTSSKPLRIHKVFSADFSLSGGISAPAKLLRIGQPWIFEGFLFFWRQAGWRPPTTKGQKAPKRLAVRRVCPCESTLTWLNDFIFCPASIYFHNLYGTVSSVSFQDVSQINGSSAHRRLDSGKYSTRKTPLSGISVYSEKYNLIIFPFNFYCCRLTGLFTLLLSLIFPFNFYFL